MENLVSIIIPCYNAEKYIIRALDSISNQTFKNLEVICIDDGSKDNTIQVIREYMKQDKINIKLVSTENRGVSSARNTGIEMAAGKYVMFLDADDVYEDILVEYLITLVEKKNVDTAYTYWCSKRENMNNEKFEIKSTNQLDMMRHFMYRKTPVSFVNFIYRKSILEDYHIRFEKEIRYGEDNLFFWKYLCHIESGSYIDAPMYWYFQNEASALHNPSWDITQAVAAIEKAEAYMEKNSFQYVDEFKEYMPARTKFSIAKEFAKYGQKENFYKFYEQYNLKKDAKRLINKNGIILTSCALLLKFSPNVFYRVINVMLSRKEFW